MTRRDSTRIIAIDPGLDCTGWAVFVGFYDDGRLDLDSAGSWRTDPATPLPDRLCRLASGLEHLVAPRGMICVIEVPHPKAVYGRQRGRDAGAAIARGLAALHQAIGALILTAYRRGFGVVLLEAPAVAKKTKQAQARSLLRQAGLPEGNADLRDAVWLGAYYLTRGPSLS